MFQRCVAFVLAVAISLASGGALAQQRPAQSPEETQLRTFIGESGHLESVIAALAAFEPLALQGACKDFRPVKGVEWRVVDKPIFERGKTAPHTGLWQETWEVSMCGKTAQRSVAFLARPDQGILPLPMFPGQSLANVKEQVEAGQMALDLVAPGLLQCPAATRPAPIQVTNSAVTNRANLLRGFWSERWTVAGCSRTADIDVDFSPGPGGKSSFAFRNR